MASVIRGNDNFDSSSVGTSRSFGGVGSYTYGRPANTTAYAEGATVSNLVSVSDAAGGTAYYYSGNFNATGYRTLSVSGTWRAMHPMEGGNGYGGLGIWVRIS